MAAKSLFRSICNVGRQRKAKGRSLGGEQCEIRINRGGSPHRRSASLSVSIQGYAQAVRTVFKATFLTSVEGSGLRRVLAEAASGSESFADARACAGIYSKTKARQCTLSYELSE